VGFRNRKFSRLRRVLVQPWAEKGFCSIKQWRRGKSIQIQPPCFMVRHDRSGAGWGRGEHTIWVDAVPGWYLWSMGAPPQTMRVRARTRSAELLPSWFGNRWVLTDAIPHLKGRDLDSRGQRSPRSG